MYAELEQRAILGDYRPGAGIRLGPHFFTADDELRFAVDQIAEILDSGAYSGTQTPSLFTSGACQSGRRARQLDSGRGRGLRSAC